MRPTGQKQCSEPLYQAPVAMWIIQSCLLSSATFTKDLGGRKKGGLRWQGTLIGEGGRSREREMLREHNYHVVCPFNTTTYAETSQTTSQLQSYACSRSSVVETGNIPYLEK